MKLSKRKKSELKAISVLDKVLQYYGHTWINNPPSEWSEYERRIYDMLSDVENKMLAEFFEILGVSDKENG